MKNTLFSHGTGKQNKEIHKGNKWSRQTWLVLSKQLTGYCLLHYIKKTIISTCPKEETLVIETIKEVLNDWDNLGFKSSATEVTIWCHEIGNKHANVQG